MLITQWLWLRWAILGICWGLFCLVWIIGAIYNLWKAPAVQMWSSSAVAKAGHELRTDGPYRITRHPIYTGILGMLFGTMLMSGLGLYLFIFILGIVIFEVKLHLEERLLTETFGEQYVQYKRRVPQLIPGLKWRTQTV